MVPWVGLGVSKKGWDSGDGSGNSDKDVSEWLSSEGYEGVGDLLGWGSTRDWEGLWFICRA